MLDRVNLLMYHPSVCMYNNPLFIVDVLVDLYSRNKLNYKYNHSIFSIKCALLYVSIKLSLKIPLTLLVT